MTDLAANRPPPVVLVVDDEDEIADLYARWLADDYYVKKAYAGEDALGMLDEELDVVLLDRLMPERSGDEVLEAIRGRGLPCRVCMVTAVEPDFDIVDMGFDEYLTKPVTAGELHETVARLCELSTFEKEIHRLYALASKKAVLEAEKPALELERSDRYAELIDTFEDHRRRADALLAEMGQAEVESLFGTIGRPLDG